jgi:hypothetical protein
MWSIRPQTVLKTNRAGSSVDLIIQRWPEHKIFLSHSPTVEQMTIWCPVLRLDIFCLIHDGGSFSWYMDDVSRWGFKSLSGRLEPRENSAYTVYSRDSLHWSKDWLLCTLIDFIPNSPELISKMLHCKEFKVPCFN